jgi:zinc/manganese transport system ATP-binding protein
MKNLITLENVTLCYGRTKAVRDVSGSFCEGSLTAIAGPNGAGKSTLLKAIAGILKPSAGRVVLAPEIANRVAYLPQINAVERDYPFSVLQTVYTGLWPEIGSWGAITASHKKRAMEILAEVGIADLAERQIAELSGGQFQRLLFARVIMQDARLILLDEPFTGVDGETIAKLIQILLGWHREGRTVICVLHDLLLIHKYFPDSFVLAGQCLGRGHTHDLFQQKLLSFDLDSAELFLPGEVPHEHTDHVHGGGK